MKYVNATAILPESLILEIQKYVQGESIYIPKPETTYQKWGTRSGGRKLIDERNTAIRMAFKGGRAIEQLAEEYFLSIETIKKIVYSK
ncbi:CD3324 family protein [Ammoniphilus sp. 3BR4]|uniref:CD3324 family protein n=1 Tax=Ammoniphilus sp. 3BR4 TaxID=3158265 RepID=UPI003466C49B